MTGILFDLDGTLLDTLADLRDATNYALRLHGFPARELEEIRQVVGNGAANQIRRSLPAGTPEEQVQAVLADYLPYYAAHCQVKTRPYPGIPEVLAALGREHPLAIVSNKPHRAVTALCREFFPGILAMGERPLCPRKPDPEMLFQAMVALGVEEAVYVGDSEVDIRTAANAGVPCISVTWGFRDAASLAAAGAAVFCPSPEELPERISALLGSRPLYNVGRKDHGQ